MKEGKKPENPEKTPGGETEKIPHATARRFKPQARLEPAQWHWWQARKADSLTVTPRVAPNFRFVRNRQTLPKFSSIPIIIDNTFLFYLFIYF